MFLNVTMMVSPTWPRSVGPSSPEDTKLFHNSIVVSETYLNVGSFKIHLYFDSY